MFIPLGTDRLANRRVIVTPILIGLNLAVFAAMLILAKANIVSLEETIKFGQLSKHDFQLWGLVTSTFLHDPGSLMHIGFNMLFLWVFGQAVESRLGSIGFAGFYFAGGIASGVAHLLASPAPAIGASGAVAAVSGAFLVLFPRTTIKVLFIFFIIGIYHIPAMWFIGLYIAIDLLSQISEWLGTHGQVAYAAHLGGYLFGAVVGLVLLATGLLPRTDMDLLYLFKQARRRKAMRHAVAQPSTVWTKPTPPEAEEPDDPLAEHRQRIVAHLAAKEYDDAQTLYTSLLDEGKDVALPQDQQIDIANRLLASGATLQACRAYELLLERRGDRRGAGATSDEIRLLLASITLRRLDQPKAARKHFGKIKESGLPKSARTLFSTLRVELEAHA
jgi:membrane associated rhomboid family serine protease